MTRLIAIALLVSALTPTLAFAVDGKKAAYIGGTVAGLKEEAEGTLTTSDETALQFDAKKDGRFAVKYADITSLEYGQKAGRRVGVAIMVSPLALFSKKRKHYLTIGYKDAAGTDQAAVMELGKDIVRTSLTVIATRSGKPIEYQDDEARKSGMGGSK
jgi:hypothetical protein